MNFKHRENYKMNIERLLIIEPHPDDMILIAGGLVAKISKEGGKVYVVTITDGGGASKNSEGDMEFADLRLKVESKKADEILGVTKREILGYPTRSCYKNGTEIYESIFKFIRKYQPDLVITTHKDKKHPDHSWCAERIQECVFQASENIRLDYGKPVYANMWYGEYPRSQLKKITRLIDITLTLKQKIDAMAAQKSQIPVLGERILHDIEVLAAYRAIGLPLEIKYCEAFKEIPVHYKIIL